jgi:protein-S-isoprenylcysteine O-methyltransferase Ste14
MSADIGDQPRCYLRGMITILADMNFPMPTLQALSFAFLCSELALLLVRRSGGSARSEDRGSLRRMWITISVSITAGIFCSFNVPALGSPLLRSLMIPAIALFVFGVVLRWYAILYLGRFFTVNVAIAADHQVVDTGPYRFVRHPSYTGSLLMFLGLAIISANWLSFVLIFLPPMAVFMHRIGIEEAALRSALGHSYETYCARTRRLVPFVY